MFKPAPAGTYSPKTVVFSRAKNVVLYVGRNKKDALAWLRANKASDPTLFLGLTDKAVGEPWSKNP